MTDVNNIINTCFSVDCSPLGVCTEQIMRKKNGQVLNKTVAKNILEVPFCKSKQIYLLGQLERLKNAISGKIMLIVSCLEWLTYLFVIHNGGI